MQNLESRIIASNNFDFCKCIDTTGTLCVFIGDTEFRISSANETDNHAVKIVACLIIHLTIIFDAYFDKKKSHISNPFPLPFHRR